MSEEGHAARKEDSQKIKPHMDLKQTISNRLLAETTFGGFLHSIIKKTVIQIKITIFIYKANSREESQRKVKASIAFVFGLLGYNYYMNPNATDVNPVKKLKLCLKPISMFRDPFSMS